MTRRQPELIIQFLVLFVLILTAGNGFAEDQQHRRRTIQQMLTLVEQAVAEKQIITDLKVSNNRGRVLFDVTMADNPDQTPWMILLNVSQQRFQKATEEYEDNGYEITVKRPVRVGRQTLYSVVWTQKADSHSSLTLPDRPVPSTGQVVPELEAFDELFPRFMKEHNIAGATVAIVNENRLLYSRGFGYSDVERQTLMQPDARMRIASISKPITAVAVLQLIQNGKLKLDSPILPILEQGRFLRKGTPTDERWNDVTIRHLLNHTGGWNRDISSDPMFDIVKIARQLKLRTSARQDDIIRYMLQQPLDSDPGTKYSYSNFGYSVLGRIIEILADTDYDDYVETMILEPAQMSSTTLARTRLDDRQRNEPRYYMQKQTSSPAFWSVADVRSSSQIPVTVQSQYGRWDIEVMDSHGGWLSSAPDLVRFVATLHDDSSELLNHESRQLMVEQPPETIGRKYHISWYACGWQVRRVGPDGQINIWHNGALDGTSTLLVRRSDGLTWAVLFNTDFSTNEKRLSQLIDPLMHITMRSVATLPDHDLFDVSIP